MLSTNLPAQLCVSQKTISHPVEREREAASPTSTTCGGLIDADWLAGPNHHLISIANKERYVNSTESIHVHAVFFLNSSLYR